MSEHKFTPGPWAVMNSAAIWMIYGPLGERICKLLSPDRHKIRTSNANLIAAAPDLLQALEFVIDTCKLYGPADTARGKAERAIKKALGE